MAATVLTWPRTVLVPATVTGPNPIANNTSGGVGFDQSEQIIGNTPGHWEMTYGNIAIYTSAQVLAWRALEAQLQGRLNPIRVPIYDSQRRVAGVTAASFVGDVLPGAVTATIKINAGASALVAGKLFNWGPVGFAGQRLFMVSTIDGTATDGSGNSIYDIHFVLPARERMSDGDTVGFDPLQFRCRLKTDDAMKLPLDLLKFASPSLEWREDI